MGNNILQQKSYQFALDVIDTYRDLQDNKHEYVLSKQLLRCGTSVGVNVEEAIGGITTNDFLCKLAIAYKEAREANYWSRILKDKGYLDEQRATLLTGTSMDLIRIMAKIQLTTKKRLNKKLDKVLT